MQEELESRKKETFLEEILKSAWNRELIQHEQIYQLSLNIIASPSYKRDDKNSLKGEIRYRCAWSIR